MAVEGTAFGAMALATNGEHESQRSAGGQSSIFISGTTATEGNRFWRALLIGSVVSQNIERNLGKWYNVTTHFCTYGVLENPGTDRCGVRFSRVN